MPMTETLSHSLREDCPKRPADMSMGRSYPTSMSRGGRSDAERSDAEHSAAQFPVQRLVKTVRFPTHHPTLVHPPREHTQGGQLLKGFLLAQRVQAVRGGFANRHLHPRRKTPQAVIHGPNVPIFGAAGRDTAFAVGRASDRLRRRSISRPEGQLFRKILIWAPC